MTSHQNNSNIFSFIIVLAGMLGTIVWLFPSKQVFNQQPTGTAAAPLITTLSLAQSKASIDWTQMPFADFYNVYIDTTPDFEKPQRFIHVYPPISVDQFKAGVKYYVAVTSLNNRGESNNSDLGIINIPLPAPQNLRAVTGNHLNHVYWDDVPLATDYIVYWHKQGEDSVEFHTQISGAKNEYIHIELENNVEYAYRVVAQNSNGISEYSDTVSSIPLETPANIQVTVGNGEAELNWDTSESALSYNVYVSKESFADIDEADKILSNLRSNKILFKNLENGEKYFYAISAQTKYGESALSELVQVQPVISTPDEFSVMEAEGSNYLLWAPVDQAKSYMIYWDTQSKIDEKSRSIKIKGNQVMFVHKHLEPGKSYFYRIAALGKKSTSELSPVASSLTARIFPPEGNYEPGQVVHFTCSKGDGADCSIFFSTDEDNRTDIFKPYDTPIVLNKSTTIRYFAKDEHGNAGPSETAIYIIAGKPQETQPAEEERSKPLQKARRSSAI